jgi:uncharacterized protein involved in exopolysaccharide biosynthesis
MRRLAALLWSRRWLLAAFIVVAVVASALYALTRTIEYESKAELAQVKEDNSQLGGAISSVVGQLGGLVGGLGGLSNSGTSVEESVEVLRSRDFSLHFMNEHGVLQFLFPHRWDSTAGRWKVDPRSSSPSLMNRLAAWLSSMPPAVIVPRAPGPSPDQAMRAFESLRAIEVDRRTNFVRLSIRGPTPEMARAWATAMITELNDLLRQRALEDARRAVTALSQKVETEPLQSTRVIASALLESQLRHEVSAESRREYALRVLDPPSLPDERYAPRRTRIVLIGAMLGFFLGAMYVVLQAAWWQYRRGRAGAATSGGRGA